MLWRTAAIALLLAALGAANLFAQDEASRPAPPAEVLEAYELAKEYSHRPRPNAQMKDAAKAVEYFNRAAKLGHPASQEKLARMYLAGEGVEKNLAEAIAWFKRAAEHPDSKGPKVALAQIYLSGKDIPPDEAEGERWLRRFIADSPREMDGEYLAGNWYARGRIIPKNSEKVVYWLRRSAAKGHFLAQRRLNQLVGIENPTEAEIEAYLRREMARTGAPGVP
jgi:hypothetical protein